MARVDQRVRMFVVGFAQSPEWPLGRGGSGVCVIRKASMVVFCWHTPPHIPGADVANAGLCVVPCPF